MPESEWQTRKQRIDTKLEALGWTICPHQEGMDYSGLSCHAVEELPTQSGPADYGLFVDGQLLGILEAKKVAVSPQNVLEQAKRYAKGAVQGAGEWHGYKVPFLFASNGEIIWYIDVRAEQAVSRKLENYHTPTALQQFFNIDLEPAHNWLLDTPIEQVERLRPYQVDSIEAIERNIMAGKRQLLVAKATGTGKTFMTVAQVYRLLESKRAKRVLFLVDRKALAAQAVSSFNAFTTPKGNKFTDDYELYSQKFRREDFGDDEPYDPKVLPNQYLTDPKPNHTFVYVCTIQRMSINLGYGKFGAGSGDDDDDDDAGKVNMPIHAFDIVIADECHRGYTLAEESVWRNTINHFDAVKIGLTATPAAHTVNVFGKPVYRYTVEQAIKDGFLVDWEAVGIKSGARIDGVFLEEGERVEKVDTESGIAELDELEAERDFDAGAVERDVTSLDSNRKIIEEVAQYAAEHERETGRFPKILIFAVNDIAHKSHADQLVQVCRDVFGQGDEFVKKITGSPSVDRPLQRIREFRNRPEPKVVVTVDMLSTGVDIPSLEFIVFARPVKSRILWEQMLGRGTRLCREINKTHFTVFDCFDGTLIERFKNVSAFDITPPRKETTPIAKVIENIYENIDRGYNTKVLIKRLHRIEKNMSGEARESFEAFIPDGDMGRFAGELEERLRHDFTGTMEILRNEKFLDLLENYPRAKKTFTVALEHEDEVTSRRIERYGSFDRAEDYLDALAKFVKENANEIEAINILMEIPKAWNPEALTTLRKKLTQNDFTEKELQKAHKKVNQKALADIISMVKHAANHEEPLLNAEERVDRALAKISSAHSFNEEQQQWLAYIREHLATTLTIAEADFEEFPIFFDRGGKGRARKIFGETFKPLIEELNAALAA